jgi:hypothetical protein
MLCFEFHILCCVEEEVIMFHVSIFTRLAIAYFLFMSFNDIISVLFARYLIRPLRAVLL